MTSTSRSSIPGVKILSSGQHTVAVVESFTDDLKQRLRDRLSHYCYGSIAVDARPSYYSFSRTATEFLTRFNGQGPTTRIGMVGELLTHLLVEDVYHDLDNFSLFLNKEERSIKKGFDLTFFAHERQEIWYAEVKTTAASGIDANPKARNLFARASSDLGEKLTASHRRSLWDAALGDAAQTLFGARQISVRELLQDDSVAVESQLLTARGVVLAAAVIQPVTGSLGDLDLADLAARLNTLTTHTAFDEVRFLAIQKGTIQKVIEFFEEEAA